MKIHEFTTQQPDEWMRAIERCAPYDVYHLPQYHAVAEEAGEGAAHLFVYTDGTHTIALPLLVRSLDDVLTDRTIGIGWRDATSVYGYPGPLASGTEVPDATIGNFQSALIERLRELRVVTVFSRLHPLFPQRPLLAGLGDFQTSRTVSIDLTLPVDMQRSKFRKSFKDAIKKLRRLGLTVVRDGYGLYLEEFTRIYHETMHRVGAAARYFFPASYFEHLRESLGLRLHLFVCLYQGTPICGGLFLACQGILQYHLGGTLNETLKLAPMKLLVDEVRLWGSAQGLQVCHLGGGTTSNPDDPLLYFKCGFSDRRHEFSVWRWVVSAEQNKVLCEKIARRNQSQGLRAASVDFFPEYRCPTVPCVRPAPASSEGKQARASGPLVHQ